MRKVITESERIERLQMWYSTPYGVALRDYILNILKVYLKRIPVQSFIPVGLPLLTDKPLHVSMGEQISLVTEGNATNIADLSMLDSLPLETDSQSCLVYHHLLDVIEEPYQLLREANRVLDDAGYLIVISFNPWSLYGLCRTLRVPWDYFQQQAPWVLNAYSQSHLINWLRLLEFVPVSRESCGFIPPIVGAYSDLFLDKSESAISHLSQNGGMVNVSLFSKNLAPVTPIRTRWKLTSVKMRAAKLQTSAQSKTPSK